VEVIAHIEALRAEGELMAVATAAANPGAGVPTCPEWKVRDLVRHLGGVHRWATAYVAGARMEAGDVRLEDVVGTWPEDAALAEWNRRGCAALADALAAAPDDLRCWTFLPAPSPRAMWARRQAHETAIHRVDAELAAQRPLGPFGPVFAADGVDELLTCFVPRRSSNLAKDTPASLSVRCSDTDAAWVVHIGPEGVTTSTGAAGSRTDCSVRGAAADLYLALWNRAGPEGLDVEGDVDVLGLFLDTVHVRWS
jgi:uncharacterized protein (TIGR03083 family)